MHCLEDTLLLGCYPFQDFWILTLVLGPLLHGGHVLGFFHFKFGGHFLDGAHFSLRPCVEISCVLLSHVMYVPSLFGSYVYFRLYMWH